MSSAHEGGVDGARQVLKPKNQVPVHNPSGSDADPGQAIQMMKPFRRLPDSESIPAEMPGDSGGLTTRETPSTDAPAIKPRRAPLRLQKMETTEIVGRLTEESRRWNDVVDANRRLILQAKGIMRRYCTHETGELSAASLQRIRDQATKLYDDVVKGTSEDTSAMLILRPFLAAMQPFEEQRGETEQMIRTLVRQMPIWKEWAKDVWGLSDLWFGLMIGETGDVGRYHNPAKLWKRMGLAVINGERQRKCADAEKAKLHGYTPRRRALVWNIEAGLIGCMGRGPRPMVGEDISLRDDLSPYQKLFIDRIRYEADKDPSHARPQTKDGKESFSLLAKKRAKRYVGKRMLRELWVAWRKVYGLPLPCPID